MSHYTINGRPAGYFIAVLQRHEQQCAEAVAAGTITTAEAAEIQQATRDATGVTAPEPEAT